MWSVPNICLTIFGLVLMVTPLALWVAWTRAIFIGVLVAAFISLIGAVIVTRTKKLNSKKLIDLEQETLLVSH